MCKLKKRAPVIYSGTMVEHFSRQPKVMGLSPAATAATGRQKITNFCFLLTVWKIIQQSVRVISYGYKLLL